MIHSRRSQCLLAGPRGSSGADRTMQFAASSAHVRRVRHAHARCILIRRHGLAAVARHRAHRLHRPRVRAPSPRRSPLTRRSSVTRRRQSALAFQSPPAAQSAQSAAQRDARQPRWLRPPDPRRAHRRRHRQPVVSRGRRDPRRHDRARGARDRRTGAADHRRQRPRRRARLHRHPHARAARHLRGADGGELRASGRDDADGRTGRQLAASVEAVSRQAGGA